MGAYPAPSNLTIGGSGVAITFAVDPDSVSVNVQNMVTIAKSMGGSNYVINYHTNAPGVTKTVAIAGFLITSAQAAQLMAASSKKTVVTISGGVGIAGITGDFIITGVATNPNKPRLALDGNLEGDIQHNYNINLTAVDG